MEPKERKPPTCVQCAKPMPWCCTFQDKQLPVCENVGCPNYWLVQVGIEWMTAWYEKDG